MTTKSTLSLTTLLVSGLSLWAVACFALHGPVILAYIAIQLATSGIFALEMRRIGKTIPRHSTVKTPISADSATRAA
ncbi:MAG: hypothetical protein O3B13_01050 [Planctomycetota bacterium]|nr:hypothetical protein [Planctomycetota bacterium]MDA1161666.1 hypothetical protein [Planctomycetota bacterium]